MRRNVRRVGQTAFVSGRCNNPVGGTKIQFRILAVRNWTPNSSDAIGFICQMKLHRGFGHPAAAAQEYQSESQQLHFWILQRFVIPCNLAPNKCTYWIYK